MTPRRERPSNQSPKRNRIPLALLPVFFLAFILVEATILSAEELSPPRREVNFSAGWIVGKGIGLIKSVGWYLVPGFIKWDVNLALVQGSMYDEGGREAPLSTNLSLNLHLKRIVPFITGGVGFSLKGTFIKNLGGGLKIRLTARTNLLAEYRYIQYALDTPKATYQLHLVSAGISYNY